MIRLREICLPLPRGGEGRGEGKTLAALLLLLPALATAAGPLEPKVAVVPYQGVGAEPGVVEKLAAALRTEVASRKWEVVSADETDRRERAAAMCGEDVECLSTVGQRLDSRYVLAFGVGRVGQGLMVSALFIDAQDAKKLSEFSERLAAMPEDAAPLAVRAVDTLLQGRSPPVKLVPVEVKQPQVVVLPVEPSHKLRPVAIGVAIGAGSAAVAGGVLTGVAAGNFSTLSNATDRSSADAAQRGLNVAADVTVITAGVAAALAVVLFLVDGGAP